MILGTASGTAALTEYRYLSEVDTPPRGKLGEGQFYRAPRTSAHLAVDLSLPLDH